MKTLDRQTLRFVIEVLKSEAQDSFANSHANGNTITGGMDLGSANKCTYLAEQFTETIDGIQVWIDETEVVDAKAEAEAAVHAQYAELVKAADEIYRLTERSTVIWDRYKAARAALKGE